MKNFLAAKESIEMSNSKEFPHFKAALKSMLEKQDLLIVTLIKGIKATQTAPNIQDRAAKIDLLKAKIFTDSSIVTGFKAEKLAAYFNELEKLLKDFKPTTEEEKESQKKQLREVRKKNALLFTTDKHLELGKRSPSRASSDDECPSKKTHEESSDDDDSEDDGDTETCAMSQRPSMFDTSDFEALQPPANHDVLTAMAKTEGLRDLHDSYIELKQFYCESSKVLEEVNEEFKKRYEFMEKIAETLDSYNDPSMDESTKVVRDNELLDIICDEYDRINAELVDEFQFST